MKKMMAVIVAVMMMAGCVSAFAAGTAMTQEQALQAALDYAGLKAEQVTVTKCNRDYDDGRQVWEIKFICNGIEYEMNVDMQTGRVFDTDLDHFDRDDRDHDDFDDIFDFD